METPTQVLIRKLKALNLDWMYVKTLHQTCSYEKWEGFGIDSRNIIPYSPTLDEAIFNLALAGIIKFDWTQGKGTIIVIDRSKLSRCNLI